MDTQPLIAISGSLVGIIVSGCIAYIVSVRQAKSEIFKSRMQIDSTYRAKLYDRRLTIYPVLAEALSELGSAIRAGHPPLAKVRSTWEFVRKWDGANSIFLSPLSMSAMIDLRKKLVESSGQGGEYLSNKKARKELLPALLEVQLALKAELGVMDADGFHNPHHVVNIREAMALDADGSAEE
jgi:hypothetical protein